MRLVYIDCYGIYYLKSNNLHNAIKEIKEFLQIKKVRRYRKFNNINVIDYVVIDNNFKFSILYSE